MEQLNMFGQTSLEDKVKRAIDRLRAFEPEEGYYLAFSGGKDSQCIYHLAKEAGVKFEAHYNLTTVDPPELVQFIRKNYPDVIIEKPKKSMWRLIETKRMPPTRKFRYCCDVLKEGGGKGRIVVTGVRWAESVKRKNNRATYELLSSKMADKKLMNDNDEARRVFETCMKPDKHKRIVNPIIDWEDEDDWGYIKSRGIAYCSLYDEGFKRLGCIGCPLTGADKMAKEFERWPKYRDSYLRAFKRMLDEIIRVEGEDGKMATKWTSPEAVMDWFMNGSSQDNTLDDQIEMDEVD